MNALLDASFFIAAESGRRLDQVPEVEHTEISVVTLAELTTGVLRASEATLPGRLATLSAVESTWDPLPVDAEVARTFARIVADLRSRGRKVPLLDALIAATAISHDLVLVTQDCGFEEITGLAVVVV